MKESAWILSLVAVTFVGCGTEETPDGPAPIQPVAANGANDNPGGPGEPADQNADEQVAVQLLSYEELQGLLESHRGKVVVMDCWSTSCEPCMEEFPGLVRLDEKYDDDRLACVSLSFDYNGFGEPEDVLPQVKQFLVEQNATFDNVLSTTEADELYEKLDFGAIPTVFVYGPDGKEAKRFDDSDPDSPFSYERIDAFVSKLMAGQE